MDRPEGRVAGKVVVVTGAGRGQGAAEAAALLAEGATVIGFDLERPAEPVEGVTYRRGDVSRPGDWDGLAAWLEEAHGRLDGLVNNAGISLRARLDEVGLEDWNRALAVNLTGPLLGIQRLAPLMGAGGSIVNVSSIAAFTGHASVAYTAAKWGLRGLSRVASMELGPAGIRVNTIFPGLIETPMTAGSSPAFRAANVANAPLGRAGTPEDVAPLVVYLVSAESSYVTGAEIVVDGGQVAHGGAKALTDAVREAEGQTSSRPSSR